MKEILKNILHVGVGAAFLTKEKLEELKNELIEKGKMTQDEGKQFVDEMVKKSEEVKTKLEEQVQTTVADQLKKMNVASSEDVAELKTQIEELRSMIEKDQAGD